MKDQTTKIYLPFIRQDVGLGDVIRHVTDRLGIHPLGCGCNGRQAYLNSRVVYTPIGGTTRDIRSKSEV